MYTWSGSAEAWLPLSDDCPDGESRGTPGCVWACECPDSETAATLIGRDGLFSGEVVALCCVCVEECEPI